MTPSQTWKSRIVAIGGDPFRSHLDGQRGKVRVGNKIAFCTYRAYQLIEDRPVALTCGNHHTVGLLPDLIGKCERRLQRGWINEHLRMRNDAQNPLSARSLTPKDAGDCITSLSQR